MPQHGSVLPLALMTMQGPDKTSSAGVYAVLDFLICYASRGLTLKTSRKSFHPTPAQSICCGCYNAHINHIKLKYCSCCCLLLWGKSPRCPMDIDMCRQSNRFDRGYSHDFEHFKQREGGDRTMFLRKLNSCKVHNLEKYVNSITRKNIHTVTQ